MDLLRLATTIFAVLLLLLCLTKFVSTAPPPPPPSHCEIVAKVISETKTPFLFKIELPAQQQVEQLVFEGPGTQSVILEGQNCQAGYWQLNTFKRNPAGLWQIAKPSRAKIDGMGAEMEVHVDNSLQPRVHSRFKLVCMEHEFCG